MEHGLELKDGYKGDGCRVDKGKRTDSEKQTEAQGWIMGGNAEGRERLRAAH